MVKRICRAPCWTAVVVPLGEAVTGTHHSYITLSGSLRSTHVDTQMVPTLPDSTTSLKVCPYPRQSRRVAIVTGGAVEQGSVYICLGGLNRKSSQKTNRRPICVQVIGCVPVAETTSRSTGAHLCASAGPEKNWCVVCCSCTTHFRRRKSSKLRSKLTFAKS